ncbi:MAG: hypothetical protein DRI83_00910 [Bacteroidetes bacterium]|nr:MAG: hypothetical protein DRI83_00910 [Bacteroidota bacterium]
MLQSIRIFILAFMLLSTLHVNAIVLPVDISDLFACISEDEDSKEIVDCYIDLARQYRHINKDSSLLFCDRAYDISKRIGYAEGQCDALYRKCQTLDYMGENKMALQYNQACLNIADSIGDSLRMAKAYFKMAGLLNESASNQMELEYYHKALRIFRQRKDTSALISVYNGIGNFYKDVAIYDSSAYYYHKSIYLCEQIGRTAPLGRIIGNLGMVYSNLEDYNNAEKYLLLSLEHGLRNNDINDLPMVYSRLGVVSFMLDKNDEALGYYELAESASIAAGNMNSLNEVYVNRAQLYKNLGRYDEALPLLKEALGYYRTQDYAEGMIAIWINMGWIYAQKQMTTKAFAYYDSAIILAEENMDLRNLKGIYGDMYLLYSDLGKHKEALNAYIEYQQISDSIYTLEKTVLINELLLKYEKEKDQLHILSLENENLEKLRQRNVLLFVASIVVLMAILLVFFFIYKGRKNRIISRQKIRQLEEEKKHMAARFLVEGEEKERKRVALELHDNLGVLLSATKMQFTEIRDKSPENEVLIKKASKFLEQASKDVRKISHNLMPGLLTKLGLFEALEDLFENLDEIEGLEAIIDIVGSRERIEENKEIMIYRMVQEMANNTLKYAEANNIDLTIIVDAEELNISYADNGKGFDVEEMINKKTMGLQSIQSRVKFLDGLFKIDSSQGVGTVFRICIPLEPGHCLPDS